ncbi:acyl-CoA dehydrogenase family protein [Salipiger thiooxidans]|uniref:acyl-CoA dehydrogenase family protein n=1 Tax=Salipiger thiooxidans TaxID=282683 RepID=UPI001CD3E42B|nr:acyl-CoA dehydrogenase family protein [Salipiger thiooxidans]MBR9840859.1 oxidoreductase [Paracoccaceae bacterium]MCA0850523.1 acyl-CoA dehydrogenase family protein [Salipiger thiooxidans]
MDSAVKQMRPEPQARFESPWLTETGRRIRDQVSEIVPMLRDTAAEGEKLGALAPQAVAALSELGVFRLTLPTDFGGLALGARDTVEIISEVSRGDGAAGWTAFVAGGLRNMLTFPDQAVNEVFADVKEWKGPIAAGASIFATKVGDARKVEGGYMVSGSWHFGSGCKHAKWIGVGCDYELPGGRKARGMAILERDQVEIVDNWHVMGLKATSSNSITVKGEVFCPEHRFMDMMEFPRRMDESRRRYKGFASKFDGRGLMLVTNLSVVSIVLGMARGALEVFIDMAQKQKPFNLPYDRVADMASTQVIAAKAYGAIRAAEAVVLANADLLDRHAQEGREIPMDLEQAMVMEAVWAAHSLDDVIGELQRTIGSATASEKNPIQRFARDTRVALLHGAIRLEPMAEIYGRLMMGVAPFPMFGGGLPDPAAAGKA